MATSVSGGRSRSTRREPPTMGKQLVSFITCGCESSAPFCNLQSRPELVVLCFVLFVYVMCLSSNVTCVSGLSIFDFLFRFSLKFIHLFVNTQLLLKKYRLHLSIYLTHQFNIKTISLWNNIINGFPSVFVMIENKSKSCHCCVLTSFSIKKYCSW